MSKKEFKKVWLVPHVHWDREWYFSAEESKIYLANNMQEYLSRLETDNQLNTFVLDGQTVMLEDYLSICPAERNRITQLVQANKLIIGPWYTLTDLIALNGETIVRNLQYGIKDAKQFGDYMHIGYVPDPFGSCAQLPQIFQNFQIDSFLFWRGYSDRDQALTSEFNWCGPDGSQVLACWMPLGYAIGKYLPNNKKDLKVRLDKYLNRLESLTPLHNLLIPHGHDQMPVQRDIKQVVALAQELYPQHEFVFGTFQEYIDAQRQELTERKLAIPQLTGEFNDGKFMRVHRTIYSTRIDLTIWNKRIENKILNQLEPLMVQCQALGFVIFPQELENIWKLLMKNHAHDSISNCNSDLVNAEIAARYQLVEDKVDSLIRFLTRKIADHVQANNTHPELEKIVLVNPGLTKENGYTKVQVITKLPNFILRDVDGNKFSYEVLKQKVIDPGLVDRQIVHYNNFEPFLEYELLVHYQTIPAFSYQTLLIEPTPGVRQSHSLVTTNPQMIANQFLQVQLNANGTFDVHDLVHHQTYPGLGVIRSSGDDGDEYDYSPPVSDWTCSNLQSQCHWTVQNYNGFQTAIGEFSIAVPANLQARSQRECNSIVQFRCTLSLEAQVNKLQVAYTILNAAEDHKLVWASNFPIDNDHHRVDVPFGVINRSNADVKEQVWQAEGWEEQPFSIYTSQSLINLYDQNHNVVLVSETASEYRIMNHGQNSELELTLFRAVGYLGKENLVSRPGRPSGIKMATPDSQLIHQPIVHNWTLAFFPTGMSDTNHLANYAKAQLTPILNFQKKAHNGLRLNPEINLTIPNAHQFLNYTGNQLTFSSLKLDLYSHQPILRFYNSSWEEGVSTQGFDLLISNGWTQVALDETHSAIRMISSEVKPGEVVSWKYGSN